MSPVLKLFNSICFFCLKEKPRSLKLVFNKSNITRRYVFIIFSIWRNHMKNSDLSFSFKIKRFGTDGPVINNLPANSGDVGSIPGIDLGRSYMPQSHYAHVPRLPSHTSPEPKRHKRGRNPRLGEAHARHRRPSAARDGGEPGRSDLLVVTSTPTAAAAVLSG